MSAENSDALATLRDARNYWMINYNLVQFFQSLEEAVILGYLCSMQDYWTKHNKLKGGKWFFCTCEDMRKYTLIEARKQKIAINRLKSLGFIETCNKGQPQKRHFHVNAKRIREVLINGETIPNTDIFE